MGEKILNWIEAAQALEDGQPLQVYLCGVWKDKENSSLVNRAAKYRIKHRTFKHGSFYYVIYEGRQDIARFNKDYGWAHTRSGSACYTREHSFDEIGDEIPDPEYQRVRQAAGIAKVKKEGKYRGRVINKERQRKIIELKSCGLSYRKIAATLDCSLSTVQRALQEVERQG